MSGKKEHVVVSVISGLTINQASQISKEIMRSKEKYAPFGRGTIASGKHSNVGKLIQNGIKRLGGGD